MSRLRGLTSKRLVAPFEMTIDAWRALLATFERSAHCLHLGCGQETLAYWVRDANDGAWHPPKMLRRTLLRACELGLVRMEAEPYRCTRFFLTGCTLEEIGNARSRRSTDEHGP